MNFFVRLWKDKTGVESNNFIRLLGRIFMILSAFAVGVGIIFNIILSFERYYKGGLMPTFTGLIVAVSLLISGVSMFWMAALGDNVMKIAKDKEDKE